MRLFKGFIVGLIGLFIFITLFSLFIPSKVMITRAVVIHADEARVFTEISNLQNWKHWQPVFKADSANMHFNRNVSGISDSCEWESKGRTNQFIIRSKTSNTVSASLQRQGQNEVLNNITILSLADSSQVQVEWNALIRLKWYPWEKFYGIFIEKITGQGYEDALNSLKEYTESH